ncbi:MAG: saccharopine dehydrogenase NADP-binding domain-containing protein [Alphaproteobacteria bacterium]
MPVTNWDERPYDIIIFGATSFVGQILTSYMHKNYGLGQGLKWAIAGRSQDKMTTLMGDLNIDSADLPALVGDAADLDFLNDIAAQTRVIITTVGPYALYGSPMVEACAKQGTDYCDLTGEVQWMNKMIPLHNDTAKQSGARIVHTCGFDCIPTDLGVHFLQEQALKQFGQPVSDVKMRVHGMKGGMSGGTAASMVNMMKEAGKDPSLRKVLSDHYSLLPADAPRGPEQNNPGMLQRDTVTDSWIAPFMMAGIDTRVVHRSNALSGMSYGADFLYEEAMLVGSGVRGALAGAGMGVGMAAFLGLAALPPTRALLEKFVLPKPGEGPSPKAQEEGYYDIRFYGTTKDGQTITTQVTGDRDPGYGSTAKMLGESALCLLKDVDRNATGGGVFTPSYAMGDALRERLIKNAGLTFEVL